MPADQVKFLASMQKLRAAGAYIGLLQQLGTILEPDDKWQPTPAVPAPQDFSLKAKDVWFEPGGAALRWQHSCFIDLIGGWRGYSKLRPGKYADRVIIGDLQLGVMLDGDSSAAA